MEVVRKPNSSPVAVAKSLASLALALSTVVAAGERGATEDVGGIPQEKEFREIEVVLPAYPEDSALIEFQLRRNSSNRFFIDPNSISIGADRVVRYSAVIKSASGAVNTSYEGIRCKTAQVKAYAYGPKVNEWSKAREPQWREIGTSSADYRYTLYRDYFCHSEAIAGRNAEDLVANLKGNPLNNVLDRNR